MSRRKSSKRTRDSQNSDDEDYQGTQVEATLSESQQQKSSRKWHLMDPPEKEQKVKDLVRYLILGSSQKAPIKRDELVKNVMDGMGRSLGEAMTAVNDTLREVFGVEATEAKKGSQVVYILVNCLPFETKHQLMYRSNKELSRFGLLGVILSFLLMRPQGTATTENIWSILNHLGLMEENQHEIFGNLKDILSPFLEQGYLEREKKVVGDMTVREYRWGPRAKLEIDKKQMLMILAEVHGDDFQLWEKQFEDLIKD